MAKKGKRAQPDRRAQEPARRSRPLPRLWLAAAAVVLVAGAAAAYLLIGRPAAGCAGVSPSGTPLDLLLITLDTTRADHLGSYGWKRARTPGLDRLATEGVRFAWALSPVPITLPAHTSILTGLYPFVHGVRNNGNFYLPDKFDTLATLLKRRGYRTAAFVSAFVLDRRFGLNRGFDTYDDQMEGNPSQIQDFEAERRGDHTEAAFTAWLASTPQDRSSPFFVWLHLYDPHDPYEAPPPFGPEFADAPYDGEIAFDDAIVSQVAERLGELGLLDRTLVAIVGDHGESLGEHKEDTHTMFVYDATLHVPLILWRPGMLPAGKVVHEPVRLTDVAPTLLDLVGAPALETRDGRSLRPLIEGRAAGPDPPIYAESLMPQLYMNWAPLRAIRDDRWKFIDAPRPELYDLQADAGETRNVLAERPQTVRVLRQELEKLIGSGTGAMSAGMIDRETIERLASLGYVGAGSEHLPPAPGEVRADPKDMIEVFNRLRKADGAMHAGRVAEALPVFREVLAKDSRNAFAPLVLGTAYMRMKDYRAAIVQYRKYLELVPSGSNANLSNVHYLLGTCHLRLGNYQEADREADASIAVDPRFTDARLLKVAVMEARGDLKGALAVLQEMIGANPDRPVVRFEFAKALEQAGQTAAAQAQFEEALKLKPDYGLALAGLGTLYAREGRLDLAVPALERALAIEPRLDEARFNLAGAYQRQGRIADARAQYQRLVDTAGTQPTAYAAARQRLAAMQDK